MAALVDAITEPDDEKCEICDCDLKTRIIGGIITLVIGCIFCWLGYILFFRGDLPEFSIAYVIGSVAAIASTFFFAGWKKQKKQLLENRPFLIALIVIFACIVLLLIIGNTMKGTGGKVLVFLIILIQWAAQIFYAIVSVPGGWTAVKAIFSCCI